MKERHLHTIHWGAWPVLAVLLASAALAARAQTPPYWDVSPGVGAPLPYAGSSGTEGGGAYGSGIVATNGWVYAIASAIGSPEPNNNSIYEWSECSGWQQIALVGSQEGSAFETLCLHGNYLYAGGSFDHINGQGPFTNIAKFDLTTEEWSQVGDNTTTSPVQAIAVDSLGTVYIGLDVDFNIYDPWTKGALMSNLFMVWKSDAWRTVGGGLWSTALKGDIPINGVTALAADGTNIYVAGDIDGSTNVNSYEIIKWTGSAWQQMVPNPDQWDLEHTEGDTLQYNAGPNITQMLVSGTNLFVCGSFDRWDADYNVLNPVGFARFSTSGGWCEDDNMSLSFGGWVGSGWALALQNGNVYVSGAFDTVGNFYNGPVSGVSANAIAMWSNGILYPLGSGITFDGSNPAPTYIAADSQAVYSVGYWTYAPYYGGTPSSGPAGRWVTETIAPTAPPLVESFSPLSGSPLGTVSITGQNFSPTTSDNIVYFGSTEAAVTSASATSLSVTAPNGASYSPLTVTVNGMTGASTVSYMPTFSGDGVIDSDSLSSPEDLGVGGGPFSLAIGDLDGDGKRDLVVAHAYDGTLYVFRNISTEGTLTASSFATPLVYNVGGTDWSGLYGLALADLTGDGSLDVLVANWGNNSVTVLQNLSTSGDIEFGDQINLAVGEQPEGIAVGDLDGDGRPDIVVANAGSGTVSILQNEYTSGLISSDSFAPDLELSCGAATSAVAIGDLNGDGQPDIVAVNDSRVDDTLSIFQNQSLRCTGLTANSFASRVEISGGGNSVILGDLNGDGVPDVVVGSWGNGTVSILENYSTADAPITSYSLEVVNEYSANGYVHQVALADIDGDGIADLVAVTEMPDQLLVFKGDYVGSFAFESPVVFSDGWNENCVGVCDLDGDGRPDIAVGNCYSATVSLYRNIIPPP